VSTNSIAQLLLVGSVALILAAACVFIVNYGKKLRGPLAPSTAPRRRPSGPAAVPITRDAYAVARRLKAQGVPNAVALTSMSPAEQQFFLSAVSARLGDGTGPRAMPSRVAEGPTAPMAQPVAPLPEAALATSAIHCPVCRAQIGTRSDKGPTIKKCPGCQRRVAAKVEGDRLHVTVSYALGTPRSTPTIKK
jgi:hypothetical protein